MCIFCYKLCFWYLHIIFEYCTLSEKNGSEQWIPVVSRTDYRHKLVAMLF